MVWPQCRWFVSASQTCPSRSSAPRHAPPGCRMGQLHREPLSPKTDRAIQFICDILHTSRTEGFPLPPAEAMLSGCALVAAANRGVQEYAVEGRTALLAPIRDPEALADRVCSLLLDPVLRCRLAWNGHDALRLFTLGPSGRYNGSSADRAHSMILPRVRRAWTHKVACAAYSSRRFLLTESGVKRPPSSLRLPKTSRRYDIEMLRRFRWTRCSRSEAGHDCDGAASPDRTCSQKLWVILSLGA